MDLGLVLAVVLIALVCLPHGALDPVIAHRQGVVRSPVQMGMFLIAYLCLAGLVILAWRQFPVISLIGFLLISAFHFGRDWQRKIGLGGAAYGGIVLALPLMTDPGAVHSIFGFLLMGANPALPVLALGAIGVASLIFLAYDRRRLTLGPCLELSVLLIAAVWLDPLGYFVAFFCVLHSPRHLWAEWQNTQPAARRKGIWAMAVVTLATLVLAGIAGVFLQGQSISLSAWVYQLIFIGLAALTVPHMALLAWVERQHASR